MGSLAGCQGLWFLSGQPAADHLQVQSRDSEASDIQEEGLLLLVSGITRGNFIGDTQRGVEAAEEGHETGEVHHAIGTAHG